MITVLQEEGGAIVYAERWRSNLAFRTLFGCSESASVFRTLKARSVVNISRTLEMCSGETERQRSKQPANVYERTLTFKQERLCSIYSDRTPRTRSQSVSSFCSILCSDIKHSGLECRPIFAFLWAWMSTQSDGIFIACLQIALNSFWTSVERMTECAVICMQRSTFAKIARMQNYSENAVT